MFKEFSPNLIHGVFPRKLKKHYALISFVITLQTDLDVIGPQLQFGSLSFLVIDNGLLRQSGDSGFSSFEIFFEILFFVLTPENSFDRLSVTVIDSCV